MLNRGALRLNGRESVSGVQNLGWSEGKKEVGQVQAGQAVEGLDQEPVEVNEGGGDVLPG